MVSKYNILWQLTRVQNKKEKNLEFKLQNVLAFLYRYPSAENKERILNYLKGLKLGYKTKNDIIDKCFNEINNIETSNKDIDIPLFSVDSEKLLYLYKDLYQRNEKWLRDNYRNFELNEFLIKLYKELQKRNVKVNKNYDIYPKEKSKHKFIF